MRLVKVGGMYFNPDKLIKVSGYILKGSDGKYQEVTEVYVDGTGNPHPFSMPVEEVVKILTEEEDGKEM